MRQAVKARIQMSVDIQHVAHIRDCLSNFDFEDFTVSPIISGYGIKGYWSSEHDFWRVGKRVSVRFTANPDKIRRLLETGFGILAMDIVPISEMVM